MILQTDIQEIGKFQRTHALRGELNVVLNTDVEYIEDGNPIVVEIEGCRIPFYAESVRPKGSTSYLIKLEGVDDIEEANKFVNKPIYALKEKLKEYQDDDVIYISDLVGYEVADAEAGVLGKITAVDDSTTNTLLYIERPDGEELIVPAHEELIEYADPEEKKILLNLPPGLLEINS